MTTGRGARFEPGAFIDQRQKTHFKLLPGEEVRSPLVVLQFWQGDRIHAQNTWRRWMVAHNIPRSRGKLPAPFTSACMGLHQSEASEIGYINAYLDNGAKLDYWWMDAGWYPCRDWPETGTWEPDPARFPRGIRAVSDHAHARGMKTVLWFEPERVHAGSWLFQNHPAWLLGKGGDRLLNLGNPEARRWLTDHIDRFLTEQGIDLYRQDFNIDPLGLWQSNDPDERQGITEIRHYYPLTPYSLSEHDWIAWQFDRPSTGSGMLQAFRRAKSDEVSRRLKLFGLDPESVYELRDLDRDSPTRATGRALMGEGLLVELPHRPQALLLKYRRLEGTTAAISRK